jgi:hypothetical protein
MSRRACTSLSWLRALVALLAVLCGSGAHEALHHLGVSHSGERPTAPLEAHDTGCPHRGDAPVHEHSLCVLCKTGGPQHATLPTGAASASPLVALGEHRLPANDRILLAPIPGSLGARAPPVTVG